MSAQAKDVKLMGEDVLFVPASGGKRAMTRTMEGIFQMVTGVAVRHYYFGTSLGK